MKKILALVALISVSLVSFTAAAHGPSPQKVEKTVVIKADPAKVWALVKDFGGIQKWHPNVAGAKVEKSGEDTLRMLTYKDKATATEKLRSADDASMKLKYEITTSTLPFTDFNSTMTVEKGDKPGESKVTWMGRFYRLYKLNPPIPEGQDDATAVKAVEGIFDSGLANLQKVAEGSK